MQKSVASKQCIFNFIYLFFLQRALRCIFFTNEKQPNSLNPKTTAKVLDGMVIQANQKLSTRIK